MISNVTSFIGILVKVKVVKNKVFPPFRVIEFEVLFGSGINKLGCLIDAAESLGLIERKGSWYNYGELKLGQGKKLSIETLNKDAELLQELEIKIKKLITEKSTIKFEPRSLSVDEGILNEDGDIELSELELENDNDNDVYIP